jgi:hypothetical protein
VFFVQHAIIGGESVDLSTHEATEGVVGSAHDRLANYAGATDLPEESRKQTRARLSGPSNGGAANARTKNTSTMMIHQNAESRPRHSAISASAQKSLQTLAQMIGPKNPQEGPLREPIRAGCNLTSACLPRSDCRNLPSKCECHEANPGATGRCQGGETPAAEPMLFARGIGVHPARPGTRYVGPGQLPIPCPAL